MGVVTETVAVPPSKIILDCTTPSTLARRSVRFRSECTIPNRAPSRTPWDMLPETLPGLNIQSAMKSLNLDAGVFKRILLKFLNTNHATASAIQSAFAEKEAETLRYLAHSLKGSANNLGARGLAAVCARMEAEAKAGAWAVVKALVPRVKAEFRRVEEALKQEMPHEHESATFQSSAD